MLTATRAAGVACLRSLAAVTALAPQQCYPTTVAWVRHASTAADGAVGFIGVGNMGAPMAANLLKAGYRVVVYDRNPDALAKLAAQGAQVARSPQQIGETEGVSVAISMLPMTQHVQDAYEGPQGLLRARGGLRPSLLIDSSTILPTYTAELADKVASCALHPASKALRGAAAAHAPCFVDAPVSGGVPGAVNGTLTFMCGGDPEAMAAAQPYLQAMGKKIVHCGKAGLGQAAKVCNNLALGIQMAAISEALALGISVGLDPAQLSAVFNTSSARCWSSDSYNPVPGVMEGVPSAREYSGGFNAALMLKDLRLALQLAESTHQPAPLGEAVSQLYAQVVNAAPNVDFSAVFKHVYKSGQGKDTEGT